MTITSKSEVPSNSTVTGSTSLNHPFKLSVEIVNVSSKFPSFSIVNVIVFWPGAIFISEEVVRVNELVLLTSMVVPKSAETISP